MGGGTVTANAETLRFYSDGSFSTQRTTAASSGSASGWTKAGNAGTYQIDGAELSLEFRSGQTVKTSLFYDSGKDGRKALWIGGAAYAQNK